MGGRQANRSSTNRSSRSKENLPRRSLKKVVSRERVKSILERLGRVFSDLRLSVPPPADDAEARRREDVLDQMLNGILLRAFAYVDEYHPAVARALVIGGRKYAEEALRGEEAEFVVRIKAAKEAPDFMVFPGILDSHDLVLRQLRDSWYKQADPSAHHQKVHYVSKKGRYGVAQRSAARRKALVAAGRIDTVRRLVGELFAGAEREMPDLRESTIKSWLTRYPTPAKLSYKIVGFWIGKSPRQVETMLTQARKYMKEAEEHHKVLDQWGWARAGGQSTPPD